MRALSAVSVLCMLCAGTPSPSHHELGVGARMRGSHNRARLARNSGRGRQKVVRRGGHNGAHLEAALGLGRKGLPGLHAHAMSAHLQEICIDMPCKHSAWEWIHEPWSHGFTRQCAGCALWAWMPSHCDSIGCIVRVLQSDESIDAGCDAWICQSCCQPEVFSMEPTIPGAVSATYLRRIHAYQRSTSSFACDVRRGYGCSPRPAQVSHARTHRGQHAAYCAAAPVGGLPVPSRYLAGVGGRVDGDQVGRADR